MDQELLGKLLIASPGLEDIRFRNSVVLICEHSTEATMGLILNKPLNNFNTFKLFDNVRLNDKSTLNNKTTFFGGPVHINQGFIIHSNDKQYSTSETVSKEVMLTTSDEILKDISEGLPPTKTKICLGCAVWNKDQLNNEILDNSWIISNSKLELVFYNNNDKEVSLWNRSLKDIGINPDKLVTYSGKA